MYSLKLAHLVRDMLGADVIEYYRDMRTYGKQYEAFYERVQRDDVHFIRFDSLNGTGQPLIHIEQQNESINDAKQKLEANLNAFQERYQERLQRMEGLEVDDVDEETGAVTIHGNATNLNVLSQSGAENADVCVCLMRSSADNLTVR